MRARQISSDHLHPRNSPHFLSDESAILFSTIVTHPVRQQHRPIGNTSSHLREEKESSKGAVLPGTTFAPYRCSDCYLSRRSRLS